VAYSGQYTKYQSISISNNVITDDQSGERLANNLTKTQTLWENSDLKFYTDSKLYYRYYIANGDTSDLVNLIEGLNLQKTFWQGLSTTVGINYTLVNGSVPSIFRSAYNDYLTAGGSLTNSWAWNWKTLGANVSGGYNFTKSVANPLYLSANWNPNSKGGLNFSTVAYLQDDVYYQAGLGVSTFYARLIPRENWKINIGLNYDFQNSSWNERYFQSDITQQLSKDWRLRLSATYSDVVGDFSVLNFDLAYDWHCRELVFSYDYIEGTYALLLNFKAFPQVSLGTDIDPAGLLYQ
jgi:hypothetical protein